MLKIDEKNLA